MLARWLLTAGSSLSELDESIDGSGSSEPARLSVFPYKRAGDVLCWFRYAPASLGTDLQELFWTIRIWAQRTKTEMDTVCAQSRSPLPYPGDNEGLPPPDFDEDHLELSAPPPQPAPAPAVRSNLSFTPGTPIHTDTHHNI